MDDDADAETDPLQFTCIQCDFVESESVIVCRNCGRVVDDQRDELVTQDYGRENFAYKMHIATGYNYVDGSTSLYQKRGVKRRREGENDSGTGQNNVPNPPNAENDPFGGLFLPNVLQTQTDDSNEESSHEFVDVDVSKRRTFLGGRMRQEFRSENIEVTLRHHLDDVTNQLGLGPSVAAFAWERFKRLVRLEKSSKHRFGGPEKGKISLVVCLVLECGERGIPVNTKRAAEIVNLSDLEFLAVMHVATTTLQMDPRQVSHTLLFERLAQILYPDVRSVFAAESITPVHITSDNQLLRLKQQKVKRLAETLYFIPSEPLYKDIRLRSVAAIYIAASLVDGRRSPVSVFLELCRDCNVSEQAAMSEVSVVQSGLLEQANKTPWATDLRIEDLALWGASAMRWRERKPRWLK